MERGGSEDGVNYGLHAWRFTFSCLLWKTKGPTSGLILLTCHRTETDEAEATQLLIRRSVVSAIVLSLRRHGMTSKPTALKMLTLTRVCGCVVQDQE